MLMLVAIVSLILIGIYSILVNDILSTGLKCYSGKCYRPGSVCTIRNLVLCYSLACGNRIALSIDLHKSSGHLVGITLNKTCIVDSISYGINRCSLVSRQLSLCLRRCCLSACCYSSPDLAIVCNGLLNCCILKNDNAVLILNSSCRLNICCSDLNPAVLIYCKCDLCCYLLVSLRCCFLNKSICSGLNLDIHGLFCLGCPFSAELGLVFSRTCYLDLSAIDLRAAKVCLIDLNIVSGHVIRKNDHALFINLNCSGRLYLGIRNCHITVLIYRKCDLSCYLLVSCGCSFFLKDIISGCHYDIHSLIRLGYPCINLLAVRISYRDGSSLNLSTAKILLVDLNRIGLLIGNLYGLGIIFDILMLSNLLFGCCVVIIRCNLKELLEYNDLLTCKCFSACIGKIEYHQCLTICRCGFNLSRCACIVRCINCCLGSLIHKRTYKLVSLAYFKVHIRNSIKYLGYQACCCAFRSHS